MPHASHLRRFAPRFALAVLATMAVALLGVSRALAGDATPAPVKVTATLAQASVQAGDTAEVRFHLEIPAGQHCYPPGSQEGLPIDAKLEGDARGLTPETLVPAIKPQSVDVPGIGKVDELLGSFDVVWRLKVASDTTPGKREIKATFTHQACDEMACFPPVDTACPLTLEILPRVDVGPPLDLPPAGPAHVGLALDPERAAPGALVKVVATFFVQKGFHIYAPGTGAGEAADFKITAPAGFVAEGTLDAPPPTAEIEEPGLGKAKIYEGTIKLARSVRVPRDAKPGDFQLDVKTTWLVCDDKGCIQGKDSQELKLTIAADGATATAGKTDPGTVDATGGTSASLGALILTSILAGIAMVFMPCTYPMIPVTISIFSKGKKLPLGQTVARAGAYAAGIIISFTLVGGVVQAVLGAQGQNFVHAVATNGWLNLAIGALFVYFALSFFGYYEVALPQFLNTFVNKGLKSARGKPSEGGGVPTIALFLMGTFFVLTSYTCGAPIVLAVLTAGASVPGKATVILATAIFGVTIALPFFCLALVPSVIQSLPKGGHWFHTFKVVLGVVELAASLKFFSNSDVYWRAGLLTRPVFLAVWVGMAGFTALYLAGVLRFKHEEGPQPDAEGVLPAKISFREIAGSVPFWLMTAYLAAGLNGPLPAPEGKSLVPSTLAAGAAALEGFLPPDPYPGHENEATNHAGFRLPKVSSFDEALAAARRSKKPLFVEFTGHVCINCRVMEKTVLVTPEVQKELEKFEPGALFTDAHTPDEDANDKVHADKFGSAVIPAYYIVGLDGKILSKQEGRTSVEEFLAFMKAGTKD